MSRTILGLVGWIALCLGAGWIGSQLGEPGQWYAQLDKPPWNPPGWVFGPVWTVLYVLMGIAAWLVWKERGFAGAPIALGLFLLQLLLNVAWTGIFFGLEEPGLAFGEILVLWALILATLIAFWRVRPAAGALLVPYVAWVSFAAVLNYTLWRMNA